MQPIDRSKGFGGSERELSQHVAEVQVLELGSARRCGSDSSRGQHCRLCTGQTWRQCSLADMPDVAHTHTLSLLDVAAAPRDSSSQLLLAAAPPAAVPRKSRRPVLQNRFCQVDGDGRRAGRDALHCTPPHRAAPRCALPRRAARRPCARLAAPARRDGLAALERHCSCAARAPRRATLHCAACACFARHSEQLPRAC